MQSKWMADSPQALAQIVKQDLNLLKMGNLNSSHGDIRCITYGHLIRLAIWSLRHDWDKKQSTATRITKVADWIRFFGGWTEVEKFIEIPGKEKSKKISLFSVHENHIIFGDNNVDISF
jgi:hypothetical protein